MYHKHFIYIWRFLRLFFFFSVIRIFFVVWDFLLAKLFDMQFFYLASFKLFYLQLFFLQFVPGFFFALFLRKLQFWIKEMKENVFLNLSLNFVNRISIRHQIEFPLSFLVQIKFELTTNFILGIVHINTI